jgi:hypothetical protein
MGVATNPGSLVCLYPVPKIFICIPVVVGVISSVLFTLLVFLSSFITTFFISAFDDYDSELTVYSFYWINPYEVARDLVRVAVRIIKDESGIIDTSVLSSSTTPKSPIIIGPTPPSKSRGFLKSFFTRIVLGLPVVGAGSIVQLLMSMPMLGPVQWLARYRGSRRRGSSRDTAALVIIILLMVGAMR